MNEFFAGLLSIIGIKTRGHRIAAVGLLVAVVGTSIAMGDPNKRIDPTPERESKAAATEILQQSAIAQCREAVEFTNRRAKMGFDNVKTTKRGDILVEQPFSVPVFGMAERDNYIARCVLRKNGNFEFGIESDRRRLG